MIMIGQNGKNKMQNPCQEIILFDSSATLQDLKSILKNQKIITFDFESHQLLLDNKITHDISEDYVKEKNFDAIQKLSYDLSRWYENPSISEKITHDELNLGKLFYDELHYFLVPLINKFLELQDVLHVFEQDQFIASPFIYDLLCCMKTSGITKFGKNNPMIDSLYSNIQIKLTNSYKINLSRNNYLKLKNNFEKIFSNLLNPKKNENKKSFLFIEFDPIKYQKLLDNCKSKYNFYLFNRRKPAIWNLKSFNIIKKSKIKIMTSNDITNKNFEKNLESMCMKYDKKLDELFTDVEFFSIFFSVRGVSFWNALKPFFTNLCKKRFNDAILEIEISKEILSNNKFNAIIVWSEVGFNEQIIIHHAKKSKIPIILLQHGLYYDSTESFEHNKFIGILPFNSDIIACWGESFSSSLLKWGFPPEKIRIVGSPSYDDIFEIKKNYTADNKFILLATSSPMKNIASDLSIKTQEYYLNSIKKICETVSKSKRELVIKLHPSSVEIDITNIAKQIYPQVKIIKHGSIINLIKSCEIFITIDISTTMLEAQIFEKPIISVIVKNYNFVNATILNSDSYIRTNLDNFENTFNQLLNSSDLKKRLTVAGNEYLSNYVYFQNSSSEKFIEMLDQI